MQGVQGMTVSDYIRQTCLGVRLRKTPEEKRRLHELARIGANINQLAKWTNTYKLAAEAMDYPGREKNPPEVLRGDPAITRALIDSIDRRWKFTSSVLSWHPDDKVSEEQEEAVMDAFERVAFAGLEPDQRISSGYGTATADIMNSASLFHALNFPAAKTSTPVLQVGKKTLAYSAICSTDVSNGRDPTIRPGRGRTCRKKPTCSRLVSPAGQGNQGKRPRQSQVSHSRLSQITHRPGLDPRQERTCRRLA
ncbi:MAG: MobC family plasmid mobilization relaxosome protein [Spirochaetia bacterium]|jgi:hypothetical protein|nr:MobC family plasmid mobilization relaxosome protein [Spirochaetia bacterium]